MSIQKETFLIKSSKPEKGLFWGSGSRSQNFATDIYLLTKYFLPEKIATAHKPFSLIFRVIGKKNGFFLDYNEFGIVSGGEYPYFCALYVDLGDSFPFIGTVCTMYCTLQYSEQCLP